MSIKSLPFNMSWPSKGGNERFFAEFMSTLQLYEPKVISNFGTPLVRPIHRNHCTQKKPTQIANVWLLIDSL
jgi:hypothetical protein